jgi:hypothetical protein
MYLRRIKSTSNGDDLEVKLSVSKVTYRYFDNSFCLLSSSSHSMFLDDISFFLQVASSEISFVGSGSDMLTSASGFRQLMPLCREMGVLEVSFLFPYWFLYYPSLY